MAVKIVPVRPLKRDLRKYVQFGIDLYAGNKYFVPPLVFDEIATFIPEKNPAFEFCEAQSFLAYRDDVIVGRISGIINHAVNKKTGEKILRFGYVDFINDREVVDELFRAVSIWGANRGMTKIVGPMGFTDMDKEGMLIEGFEEMGTMATIYNHPYYRTHMERLGFEKETDWIEFRMTVPDAVPEKYMKIARIVEKRFELHVIDIKSRKWVKQNYGRAIFELINEAYKDLYGFVALTDRQIDYYIDMYLGMLRLDDVCLIADKNDKLVGVGISMPSLSKALRKCDGKLFPTGWYYLKKALSGGSDVVDLLLVAIAPEYQGKGVNALLFSHLIPNYIANGYKYAESNVELEDNDNVQKQWEYFERRQHRRRRAWKKGLPASLTKKNQPKKK
ncbi:MAG: N-acetyltransferase [Bacteroidales bacterium]|nr:N-acetyltransferase [Bacteroidales bacterium]